MNLPINQSPTLVQPWLAEVDSEFLSEVQKTQLDALFDCLWPSDHARGMPGAIDVKASRFVSRLLSRDQETFEEIPIWRGLYPAMLSALEQFAIKKFGVGLSKVTKDQIFIILKSMEAGELSDFPNSHQGITLDQKVIFSTLRRHCIQGCLADERWGGNHDRMMWRAIGYPSAAEELFT